MTFLLFTPILLILLVPGLPSSSGNPAAAASLIPVSNLPSVRAKEKLPIEPAPPASQVMALLPTPATVTIPVQQSTPSHHVIRNKGKLPAITKSKKPVKKADNEQQEKTDKKSEKKHDEKIASCGDDNVYIGKSVLQWTNPRFPSGETERMSCVLRMKRDPKCWQEIVQIKVIIVDLHLSQPEDGACKQDNITVHGSLLQGQEVGPGLQLCGDEPDDFLFTSGRKYPQRKHSKSHF